MAHRLFHLEGWFSGLTPGTYDKTSDFDPNYNCIAFAAGDLRRKWDFHGAYWPMWAAKIDHYIGLVSAYFWIGYLPCADGSLEPGFEKIAIYADSYGEWTHAAHQCEDGWWESKCGDYEDIRHQSPSSLEGDDYGQVIVYLKRERLPVGTRAFSDAADVIDGLGQVIDLQTASGDAATLAQAVLALAREIRAIETAGHTPDAIETPSIGPTSQENNQGPQRT